MVTRLYDSALDGTGLNVTQFSLLRTVSRLDRPYISSLAEAAGLDRSTLGRNLRPLEKAGLIEFGQGQDARTRLVCLTKKGARALTGAISQWQHAQDQMSKTLGKEKLTALESLLEEVVASQT